jgi:hypothetical protein
MLTVNKKTKQEKKLTSWGVVYHIKIIIIYIYIYITGYNVNIYI